MRPSALRSPVAVTRARAVPCVISVPENTWPAFWSSSAAPTRLLTGTDSPVSIDSSTDRLADCSSAMSAGTRSPSASSTMSPRTSSRLAILRATPSRSTSACGLDSSRSASSERSVRRCCTKLMPITTNTKPSSISASLRSPSTR